jgi:hypothetical protein
MLGTKGEKNTLGHVSALYIDAWMQNLHKPDCQLLQWANSTAYLIMHP